MQDVLTLTPGGLPLGVSLGFTAASVVCDNYTSNYLTLPDAGKTIPPWTYGAVVALPPGTRRALATLTPTVPAVPGPPVPVIQASLTWTDVPLPADPGHLLQQSQYAQQNVFQSVQATVANPSVTVDNVPVPAGTQAIGFIIDQINNSLPTTVTIIGDQTGHTYINAVSPVAADSLQVAPAALQDTTVQLSVTAPVASTSLVHFLAIPYPLVTFVRTVTGQALNVNSLTPAAWQVPNQGPLRIASGMNSGADATLVAAATGVTLRLFDCNIAFDGVSANSTVTLEDSNGGLLHDFETGVQVPAPFHGGGVALPIGLGVKLHNFAAAAMVVRGSLLYSTA